MAQRLVIISGGYQTGKMPLARRFMSEDAALVCVHRDTLRDALITPIDEGHMTWVMASIADRLLHLGHSAIVVAWNLEPSDRIIWSDIAWEYEIPLEWFDVSLPEVAALIPPIQAAA